MSRWLPTLALAIGIVGLGLLDVARHAIGGRAHGSRCAGNLRQLALAAIQHADDRGAFPSSAAPGALAGGVESDEAPRVARALVQEGFLDMNEVLVCPASADHAAPAARGGVLPGQASGPSWLDGVGPPPRLAETFEMSYGWTRRRLSSNCRSTTLVAADRAVRPEGGEKDPAGDPLQGNHVLGLEVARADGCVEWVRAGDAGVPALAATTPDGGALGIADPARPGRERRWVERLGDAAALLPFGLAGLLLWLRPGSPAPPVALRARGVVAVRPSQVVTLGARPALGAPLAGVTVAPGQRCPWCREAVEASLALTTCSACRAVFHAECAAPGGACTTLGCRSRSA